MDFMKMLMPLVGQLFGGGGGFKLPGLGDGGAKAPAAGGGDEDGEGGGGGNPFGMDLMQLATTALPSLLKL